MQFPPAKLLVSPKEAEEKIAKLIKEGHQIINSVNTIWAPTPDALFLPDRLFPPGLKKDESDSEAWAKFAIHLLQTLFTDDSIAREFGDSWITYPNSLANKPQLEDWIKVKIVRLQSIVQRLPLFDLAENPVQPKPAPSQPKQQSKDIFIVHGHDETPKHEVARFIERLGLHPIILHEKSNQGKTIIEKLEHYADVGFAVVILTPDDVGYQKDELTKGKPHARQNVVFELGYFIAMLGRPRVCALLKGDIEIPTDYAGVLYTPLDNGGAWKFKLATEIDSAGIDVDFNKLK